MVPHLLQVILYLIEKTMSSYMILVIVDSPENCRAVYLFFLVFFVGCLAAAEHQTEKILKPIHDVGDMIQSRPRAEGAVHVRQYPSRCKGSGRLRPDPVLEKTGNRPLPKIWRGLKGSPGKAGQQEFLCL